jgi:hypothetical protein
LVIFLNNRICKGRDNFMCEEDEFGLTEDEWNILAGFLLPTKKELEAMREKFKDIESVIEILDSVGTIG